LQRIVAPSPASLFRVSTPVSALKETEPLSSKLPLLELSFEE